jgi:exodeoxyribonuclease VII large subunit
VWIVDERSEELTRWVARGAELIDRALERAATTITDLKSRLRTLSPQGTLDRGYAIAQLSDGRVLRRATDAVHGTPLLLTLADGTVSTTVDDAAPAGPADR